MPKPVVFIIDDDDAIRLLCGETLDEAGFRVEEASDGIKAIEIIDNIAPDIILLDAVMPGLSGFEVCSTLREQEKYQYIPIIMMTGLEDVGSIEKAFDVGVTNFITKPINWAILSHHVRYIHRSSILLKDLQESEKRNLKIQKTLREQQVELDHIARHDSLTGLPNRLMFHEYLKHSIAHCLRTNQQLGVLFLDVDNFKWVNDTYGHHIGDELLKEFSRRLSDVIRDDDYISESESDEDNVVTRFGGDEFLIMLTGIKDTSGPCRVANRILDAIKQPFVISGHELHVGASVGVSVYPNDGSDADTLIKNADTAMYHAKNSGKNNYQYFSEDLNNAVSQKLDLENKIKNAIINNHFFLLYQPQIDITNGKIIGVEALIRWEDPENGLIYPDEFIPAAEDSGLIVQIGEWVINEACRQSRVWQDKGLPIIKTSINISAVQFERQGLVESIFESLNAHDVCAENIEIELTENIFMINHERSSKILIELRSKGIDVALDDFGTGFSSLSYLRRYPVDTLKIDRSFISEINESKEGEAVIEAIIQMAHAMKMKVVAEGVEELHQLEFLKKIKCDFIQGYYFYKPLTANKIEEILSKD